MDVDEETMAKISAIKSQVDLKAVREKNYN